MKLHNFFSTVNDLISAPPESKIFKISAPPPKKLKYRYGSSFYTLKESVSINQCKVKMANVFFNVSTSHVIWFLGYPSF